MSKEEWMLVYGKRVSLTEAGFLESDPESDLWKEGGIALLNAWYKQNEVPDMTDEQAAAILENEVFQMFVEVGHRFGWIDNGTVRNFITACRKAADLLRSKK